MEGQRTEKGILLGLDRLDERTVLSKQDNSQTLGAKKREKRSLRVRYASLQTAFWEGDQIQIATMELSMSPGLPYTDLLGLPKKYATELVLRVKTALQQMGFVYPKGRIVVNLRPVPKSWEGDHLDLPFALLLLAVLGALRFPQQTLAIGTLDLKGALLQDEGTQKLVQALGLGGRQALVPAVTAGLCFKHLRPFWHLAMAYRYLGQYGHLDWIDMPATGLEANSSLQNAAVETADLQQNEIAGVQHGEQLKPPAIYTASGSDSGHLAACKGGGERFYLPIQQENAFCALRLAVLSGEAIMLWGAPCSG